MGEGESKTGGQCIMVQELNIALRFILELCILGIIYIKVVRNSLT